jgi:hypothetical protein
MAITNLEATALPNTNYTLISKITSCSKTAIEIQFEVIGSTTNSLRASFLTIDTNF